jgi:hypothetical protein
MAPKMDENVPLGQLMQLEAPVTIEYAPAAQFEQVADRKAPVGALYVPGGQLVHEAEPVAAAKVPAEQLAQVDDDP